MKLYRFRMDCGRMGDVRATFAAEPGQVAAVIGKNVYFGEILGKHSDVRGTLEAGEFTEVQTTPEFVAEFARLFPGGVGHNPLDYLIE